MATARIVSAARNVLPPQRSLAAAIAVLALSVSGLAVDPVASTHGFLDPPRQHEVADVAPWSLGSYTITPLAAYDLTAVVLSSRSYDEGREAETSPIDLALGWGLLADEDIAASYDVSQDGRWYYVRWEESRLSREQIILSSANTHVLPASPELARRLEVVRPGEVVRLQGYLVEVSDGDGWSWRSSLVRSDTGDGSCEVLWVEAVEVAPSLEATTR